jgi:hypothetical protein
VINGVWFDIPPEWTAEGSVMRAPGNASRVAVIQFNPFRRRIDPKSALEEWVRVQNQGFVEERREPISVVEGPDGITMATQAFLLDDPGAESQRRPPKRHRIYVAYAGAGIEPFFATYTCYVTKLHEALLPEVMDCLARPRLAADDLKTMIERGRRDMIEKGKIWQTMKLDPRGDWGADSELGQIWWTDRHGAVIARGQFEFIGSHSTTNGVWQWAWASETWKPELTNRMQTVRLLGEDLGEEYLTTPRLNANEQLAQDFAAMALRLACAKAWYRVQLNETTVSYLMITELDRVAAAA